MVDYSSITLDLSLSALSDSTRRAIPARIVRVESTVSEIAELFEMSLAAVLKHLQVLERENFIKKIKLGRNITCRANLSPLKEVRDQLEDFGRYWNMQLDSLGKYLAKNSVEEEQKHDTKKQRKTAHPSNSASYSRKKR